ncbi:hypothetical protein DFH07DRAFT_972714 [Mycena maculata]|uniref:Uncharacterized protein n=1 Tax=Mycena maculata TaxID=230809 RepID=A0AAD7HGB7_9AGAR|nr:hypothetical protein DFH07DRAFT_972714 [Mycena maculata]
MGAGAKCDPTQVQISDSSCTVYDPSRAPCAAASRASPLVVYSAEVLNDVKLLPLPEEEFQKGPEGVRHLRVCLFPVCNLLQAPPGALRNKPIVLPIKNRCKVYERFLRERGRLPSTKTTPPSSRHPPQPSVLPPHAVPARPKLMRWDPDPPLSLENVVVMDAGDDGRHLAGDGEVRELVERRRGGNWADAGVG